MNSKTNLNEKIVCRVCLTLVLTALAQNAHAYSYKIKTSNGTKIVWPNSYVTFRAGSGSFPPGSPYRSAFVQANQYWNQTPAKFTFGSPVWGDTSLKRGNGQSEIWFSTDQNALKNAPAICYTWMHSSGGRLWFKEADIIFDANRLWSPYTYQYELSPYGGPYRPFITTAIHEMGHALGLGHENRWYNVMGQDYTHVNTHGSYTRGYAGADATQGALFLYGKTGSPFTEDLAVTHWKYDKAGGEYSVHTPTVIYNQNMNVVAWDTLNGMRRFSVRRGDAYHAQFTFENNGYNTQNNVKLAVYISTNAVITSSDQFLGEGQIGSLPAGAVWTTTIGLTIPNNLTAGATYYLGVILDHKDNVKEFNEINNASYLQIRIVP